MTGPQDLSRVVLDYQAAGDEQSHDAAVSLLRAAGLGWPRTEFDPGHFTASGFVLSPDNRSLLLIHHAKLGRWLQPGGHFEPQDHSVEDAARREVAEETGVADLRKVGESLVRIDAHAIPKRRDEPEHIHFDLGVGFQSDTWPIGLIDEVLDARWVPFDELSAYDVDEAVQLGAQTLRSLG
ncbi:MAG: NUDIX hydrolase [Acidimicrobiia bacterium]